MTSGKTFFSYSRADSEFVLKLAKDLRSAGVDVWLDQLDISAGKRWDAEIEAALENAHGQLVILSPASVGSQNVLDEVSYALEKGKHVIPILFKECQIPFRLKRLQYINFTGSYDSGFKELLKALNLDKTKETQKTQNIPGDENIIATSESKVAIEKERNQNLEREAEQRRKEQIRQDTKSKSPIDKSTSTYDSGMKKSPMKLIAAVGVIVVVLAIIIIVSMGPDENSNSPTQESELVDTEPFENNSNEANITDNYATLNDDYQPAMVVYTQRDDNGNAIHQNIFNRVEGGITIYVEAEINAPNSKEELTFKWLDTYDDLILGEKRKPVNNEYMDVTKLTGMVEDDQTFNEAGDYLVILYNAKGEEIGRQEFEIL